MRQIRLALLAAVVAAAGPLRAQDSTEHRPTGLPKKVTWTFNFDAGFGAFGFANSLYKNVRPDPVDSLGDNWLESYVKPALSADLKTGKSEVYGKISAVGERTFNAPPPLVGTEASSFQVEDAYIGWRSGTALGMGENALDLSFGREQYKIGHGMLLWDGGGEGGSRGGFWSNARKAWQVAAVARFHASNNTVEAFYLDRDEVPEAESGTRLWGGNYELAMGKATTFGASYMKFIADTIGPNAKPDRNGMNVYNVRAYTSPLKRIPGLAFELEYAHEENGERLSSTAWTAQGSYEFDKMGWKPRLSYRYAFFGGDDPSTPKNEAFDPLIPGFYDWGTWWQGELAGEYFLANSDLVSNQLRLHLTPSDAVSGGLIGYTFKFDKVPAGTTSKDIASELDAYTDWKANSNFTISFVAAMAHPQQAVKDLYQRSDNFLYGMIYIAYAY